MVSYSVCIRVCSVCYLMTRISETISKSIRLRALHVRNIERSQPSIIVLLLIRQHILNGQSCRIISLGDTSFFVVVVFVVIVYFLASFPEC